MDNPGIWTALISSGFTLIGVIINNAVNANNMRKDLEKQQAVFEAKLEELTREVREHNNFAKRLPVVEEQISSLARRVDRLEDDMK